jgi:hypothetical protein
MKSTPSELISTFRKKLTSQVILSAILLLAALMVPFLFKAQRPIVDGVIVMIPIICLVIFFILFERRKLLQPFLNEDSTDDTITSLENSLERQHESQRKNRFKRFALTAAWMIAVLVLIFLHPDKKFTGMIVGGFAGVIISSAIHGWVLMNDQLFLQDLKHCSRDAHS